MDPRIETFLTELSHTDTLDAHTEALYCTFRRFGFPNLVYVFGEQQLLDDRYHYDHSRYWSIPPERYNAFYYGRNHHLHDPLVRHCMTSVQPVYWHQPGFYDGLSRRERLLFEEGTELGVRDGMTYPLHGADPRFPGALTVFHHREGDRGFLRDLEHHGDVLHLAALYFHTLVLQRYGREAIRERARLPRLSPRERECLTWCAAGLASKEIAERLRLSERTVNFHVGNAMRKLAVRSRAEAVARALALRLIEP